MVRVPTALVQERHDCRASLHIVIRQSLSTPFYGGRLIVPLGGAAVVVVILRSGVPRPRFRSEISIYSSFNPEAILSVNFSYVNEQDNVFCLYYKHTFVK